MRIELANAAEWLATDGKNFGRFSNTNDASWLHKIYLSVKLEISGDVVFPYGLNSIFITSSSFYSDDIRKIIDAEIVLEDGTVLEFDSLRAGDDYDGWNGDRSSVVQFWFCKKG